MRSSGATRQPACSSLLSSDGIIEARNPAGEEYGLSRLAEQLRRLRLAHAETIVTAVVDDVRAFCATAELADDVTLLVVKGDGAFRAESVDEDKQRSNPQISKSA